MSAIPPITSGASGLPTESRIPVQTLGQDDFLKLLIAQLTSQDPLAPKSDTEFIAQMASFSSLEQAKVMQTDMALMRGNQEMLQANSLLGRTVEIQVNEDTVATGLVSAVHVVAGTPRLIVGDQSFDLNQVVSIAQPLVS